MFKHLLFEFDTLGRCMYKYPSLIVWSLLLNLDIALFLCDAMHVLFAFCYKVYVVCCPQKAIARVTLALTSSIQVILYACKFILIVDHVVSNIINLWNNTLFCFISSFLPIDSYLLKPTVAHARLPKE